MGKDEQDFKVVDRRASTGHSDSDAVSSSYKGDGFTMKEPPNSPSGGSRDIDFSTFIFSLATGALIHLGLAPDPMTKKTQKNIELAKQNIDLLSIIKEKTKGNLSSDEERLLESLLSEVRLKFVEISH